MIFEQFRSFAFVNPCLKLVDIYLCNRNQMKRTSSLGALPKYDDVPQGSILGPLIFILHIYHLPECSMSAILGYVDDYKIVSNNRVIINIDAKRIWIWCAKNYLEVHI